MCDAVEASKPGVEARHSSRGDVEQGWTISKRLSEESAPKVRRALHGRPQAPSGQRAQLPEGGREGHPTRECSPSLCTDSEVALPVLSCGAVSLASTASRRQPTLHSLIWRRTWRRRSSQQLHRRQAIEPPFATFGPADETDEEPTLHRQEEVMRKNRAALLDYKRCLQHGQCGRLGGVTAGPHGLL